MASIKSKSQNRKLPFYGLFAIIALLVVLILYILIAGRRDLPSIPQISISGEISGAEVSVGQSVIVQSIATDPDGIAMVEFWVNDILIGTQLNPDASVEGGFSASQIWRPADAGPYSLYVRAEDSEGYLGQSELVVLRVTLDEDETPEYASQQVFAGEGDTLASLAETYESTQEALDALNPGLGGGVVGAGASVLVPQPAGGDNREDEDEIPQVGRPVGAGSGVGQIAQVVNPPAWTSTFNPNWVNTICRAMPGLCGGFQTVGDVPPSAPTNVTAVQDQTCQVQVSWTDTSETELGFNLYRFPDQDGNGFIAEFKAGEDSGGRFNLVDIVNAGENWYYVVSSLNLAGEANSAPSDTISVECSLDALPGIGQAVEIEALTMTVSASTPADSQLYCYLSLMGNAHERIPASPSNFFSRVALDVDIAAHLGGENSRLLVIPQDDEVTINTECLALTEEGPVSLGSFERSHSSSEWDGRILSATSDSGEYTVTYRINGSLDPTQLLSQNFGLTDASIPPPYNLQILSLGVQRLCKSTSGGAECQIIDEGESLFWDIEPENQWPANYSYDDIWGFVVYYQLPDWDSPRLLQELGPLNPFNPGTQQSDPLRLCNERKTLFVSILVNTPAGVIESPMSAGYEYRQDCAIILEITLVSIKSGEVKDGLFDDTIEAFGDFYVSTPQKTLLFRWNNHPFAYSAVESDLVVSFTPYTTLMGSNNTQRGELMYLSVLDFEGEQIGLWIPDSNQAQNNNKLYVVLLPGDELTLWGYAYDHDSGGLLSHKWADDMLCDFSRTLLSRSSEDWLTFNRTITTDGEGNAGSCTVTWRVRGVARDEMPGR